MELTEKEGERSLLHATPSSNFILSSEQKTNKRRIQIKLATCGLYFVFLFSAYSGLQNIEPSLNPDIGIYSLACITGGGLASCILAPVIIRSVGTQKTFITTAICFGLWVAAHFYPKTYLLLPTAILYGLTSGCMLTANFAYITTLAIEYADLIHHKAESVISEFFGVFFMAFMSCQIWGNLLSSIILQVGNSTVSLNSSMSSCGARFCPSEIVETHRSTMSSPSQRILYMLLFIYLVITFCALIVASCCIRTLVSTENNNHTSFKSIVASTFQFLISEPTMMMLVPICIYNGMGQVVMYAYFTQVSD